MLKIFAALFTGLIVVLATACGGNASETETRDDTFAVRASPAVVVNGDNGSIIVRVGAAGSIRVQATIRDPDNVDYEVKQAGKIVTVETESDGGGIFDFGKSPGADLEITVPSTTRVTLRTSNGSIEVSGVRQSGTARTSNGRIVMDDIVGEFKITTSNGAVTITEARGVFDIETSNGEIEFSGELIPGGDNRLTSSNGSIDIKLQGTPSVNLDASTSNGSIDVDLPILLTSDLDEQHLVGTIGDGGTALFVKTSNGSITIK